jgi:hypothetical protein
MRSVVMIIVLIQMIAIIIKVARTSTTMKTVLPTTPLTSPIPLTGMPEEVVIKNYRRDGSAFWNLIHIMPVSDVYGKVRTYTHDLLSEIACFVFCMRVTCVSVYASVRLLLILSAHLHLSPLFFSSYILFSAPSCSCLLFSLSNSHSPPHKTSFSPPLSHHNFTHHILLLTPLQVVLVVGCHTEVSYVMLSTALHVSNTLSVPVPIPEP